MSEFVVALGLAFILEGLLYALFPNAMRRMMMVVIATPPHKIKGMGLVLASFGLLIIWLVRGH